MHEVLARVIDRIENLILFELHECDPRDVALNQRAYRNLQALAVNPPQQVLDQVARYDQTDGEFARNQVEAYLEEVIQNLI